jgi:hypothetical protein
LIEQCLWQLLKKADDALDEAFFFTKLAPDFAAFKPDIKTKVD